MLRSKLPESNKAILAEIKKIVEDNGAIDFASALPCVDMPAELSTLVEKYIRDGKNQYAPVEGIPELRKNISDYFETYYNHKYNPDTEITITAGGTEAVWAAITAIIHEDDEVIVIEPSYENYIPAVRINGATPIFVSLREPDYKIDWNEVIRMVNQRTRMIIVNTPHSPSGKVYCEDDFKNLQKIVAGNKIIVLCDETFSSLTYDQTFVSISKFPVLAKQTVLICSLSTALNATGWKTGVCLAPADYTKEIRKIHNYICNGSNAAIQYAMAGTVNNSELFSKIRTEYKRKRDLLASLLKGSKYKFKPSQGTWFQTIDYSEVSSENDRDFALRLVKDFGVAVFPMSTYYHDKSKANVVRLCFSRPDDVIKKGVECLLNAQEKINKN